jgi:uncharacterized membrane protein
LPDLSSEITGIQVPRLVASRLPRIDDKFMKDAAAALGPGQAALCLLIRRITADKVIPAMAPFGGSVLRTNLSDEQEAQLKAALTAI